MTSVLPQQHTLRSTVIQCCTNLRQSDVKIVIFVTASKSPKISSEQAAEPPAPFLSLRSDNITFPIHTQNGLNFGFCPALS